MGGKSYFCDYCRCYLKNDVNSRKVHNWGLSHKIAKVTYNRRFVDPAQLLSEEINKVPCTRFIKGYCKFELYCQFGHFNAKQIHQLRKTVKRLEQRAQQRRISKVTQLGWQKQLPWSNVWKIKRARYVKLPKRVPPSLKAIQFHIFNKNNLEEWG